MTDAVDQHAQPDFGRRMVDFYTGAVVTQLVDVGTRTGLFDAAAIGAATSAELAERAGLAERYVREWLGVMVAAGIVDYDPSAGTFELPPEHAELLTGTGSRNVAPMSQMLGGFSKHLNALTEAFRHGGGVPYSEFRPEFTQRMDDVWRRIYDERLLDGFLSEVPGLTERLAAGVSVADIGCGTGHAANLMAQAYPASSFVGYDLGADAIATAQAQAAAMGLNNVRFETLDLCTLHVERPFDVITGFDVIHDQADPVTVLDRVRAALADDGTFVLIDFKFSSKLEANIGNPFAALYYGISTMHCMTVSLAEGGAGLGTVWGVELAESMLHDAGFREVEVLDSPRPQNCIYICRP